jgi:hypothetical protein
MQKINFLSLLILFIAIIVLPSTALAPPGAVQNTSPTGVVPGAMTIQQTASQAMPVPTPFTQGEQVTGLGPWIYIGSLVIIIAIAGFVYIYVFR